MTDNDAIDFGPAALRTTLYSPESEQAVLGCVLISPEAYFEVAAFLKPEDFYLVKHRWIWDAFALLQDQRLSLDVITVAKELERRGQLEEAGGVAYLTQLINTVPTSLHAEAYGRIVQRDAMRRSLLEAASKIAKLAYEEARDVEEVVSEAEATVFAVSEQRLNKDLKPISEVLRDYYHQVEYRLEHQGELFGVPTGFIDLDKVLGGLQKSDLLIIAGRPGSGKCLTADAEIVLRDGRVATIREIYHQRAGKLLTLQDDWRLTWTKPADFVDDGVRPVFQVTSGLGRQITTTGSHPFLTPRGWKRLAELKPGDRIAVPRRLPVAGRGRMRACEVKLLGYLIGDGCLVHSSPEFTVGKPQLRDDFIEAVNAFGGVRAVYTEPRDRTPMISITNASGRRARGVKNPLKDWLRELNLDGKDSHGKFVPEPIFTLQPPLVALFLNRLYATDGWVSLERATIGYSTVSERLARQVQHLLLRFGVIASLRHKQVKYKDTRRPAWSVEVTDSPSLNTFIECIGIYGKEDKLATLKGRLAGRKTNPNLDTIPLEVWDALLAAKGAESWASLAHRAGIQTGASKTNLHVGKRALSRGRLESLARALGADHLIQLATSDVFWDKVQSISPAGRQQVYDLAIADTHNFIANDICVHNTGFMLSVAKNAAQLHRKRVAIFSLEMGNEQLVQRMMSQETGIDAQRLRLGLLRDDEIPRFTHATDVLSDIPVYLDDTPALSPLQLRAKCRRLQQEYGLDLVIVDYLQLMQGDGRKQENRVQEVSQISRGLKQLAREINVPVLAGAQLSRAVEQRTDKRPILSDLRESGSLEQDADIVMFIHRPDPEKEPGRQGIAEIVVAKHRNGPTHSGVELVFLEKLAKFENAAKVDLRSY